MIQFANPGALWLLTLAIPIIILYLLKRRRREVKVPSLLLWKQALEDLRAQTPFQKLRSNLLLFLQLLALVLITAVLSEPYFPSSRQGQRYILVLDTSAAMKATDEKPDRFTVARNRLMQSLDSLSPWDEAMLVTFSSQASILQSFSRNHDAIRSRIRDLQPEDRASDWKPLLQILKPLLKQKPRPALVIASDFAGFSSNEAAGIAFDPLPVGASDENAGITRAVVESLPENPRMQILFYQIGNFSRSVRNVEAQLYANGDLIDAWESAMQPMTKLDRSKEIEIAQPTTIKIMLKPADQFQTDNEFILETHPLEKSKVKLDTDNPFLLRALKILPSVILSDTAEIVIANRAPETIGKDPGIFFLPASDTAPAAAILHWDDTHPALRFIDAGLWRLAHIRMLEPPAGSKLLMETALGPIAYAIEEPGRRSIVFGFSLEDSNLPLLAGFPVFLQNSIEWIRNGMEAPLPTITGDAYPKEGAVRIGKRTAYVNFANAAESDIKPRKPGLRSFSDSLAGADRRDVSSWFLILLTCIIILEWWAFHRRIHVEA